MSKFVKNIIFLVFIFFFKISLSYGSSHEIAAIVNDEIITDKELSDRYALNKLITNNQFPSIEEQKTLKLESLETLIEEKLLSQQFKKLNLKISEEEITKAILSIEKSNKMEIGFLKNYFSYNSVSFDSFKQKITFDLMKQTLIREILSDSISINENDLNKLVLNSNQKEASIYAKIFSTTDNSENSYKEILKLKNTEYNCNEKAFSSKFIKSEEIRKKLSKFTKDEISSFKLTEINKFTNIFENNSKFYVYQLCKLTLEIDPKDSILLSNVMAGSKVSKEFMKFMDRIKQNSFIKIIKR